MAQGDSGSDTGAYHAHLSLATGQAAGTGGIEIDPPAAKRALGPG